MSTDLSQQFHRLTSREENYVLLQRFAMPTKEGPRDAIAVTLWVSRILQSFYTLMISVIVLHLWYLFVLVAIALAYRNQKLFKLTRNHGVANVTIWNSQASPLSIIKAMFDYRSHLPMYAFLWALAAFLAWAGAFAMSLLIAPTLIISAAAPANLKSIYVPTIPDNQLDSPYLRWWSLQVPTYLRAIEVLQAANPETGEAANVSSYDVVVKNPQQWRDSSDNDMYQVDYSYNITGVDFGLQHHPELKMEVRGSCRTEYSWYREERSGLLESNLYVDNYELFDKSLHPRNETLSTADGKRPITYAFLSDDEPEQNASNYTFAFLTSSMQRKSYSQGLDPWYRTITVEDEDTTAPYEVENGRPPLSCWEQTLWSYKDGPRKSLPDISQLNKLPPGILQIFYDALSAPRIVFLAQALGNSALKSSQTCIGIFFDAQTASIHSDLQRLVLGAFVSTKNVLVETTMFDDRYSDELKNYVYNETTKQFLDGTADFVIYGSGFAALSVKVLIIVPVITLLLFFAVSLLTDNPFTTLPWGYVNALKAPVLYSALDNEGFKPDSGDGWKRRSTTPHYTEKDKPALVRPRLERGTLSWHSSDQESTPGIQHFNPEEAWTQQEKKSEVRPEEVRPEEVRPEEVRPEEVRPDEVRPEETRPEKKHPEEVRREEV